MADGVISLDDRPAIAAINRANTGLDDHEKKTKTVLDRSGREWQVYGEGLVRVTDRSKNSLDRLLSSMQRQAEMAGKTGVERMIAQRDQLIAKWGQEERAVQAITKAYDKMIAAEHGGGESRWQKFGENIKGFIESPLQSIKGAAGGVLEAMGPMWSAVSAGAAVLGAVAVTGFEAAKSLAEYGLQIKNVELRTGFTSKEVGQFGFAARMAGQDASIFERMMKGLSEASDEQSSKGEKARTTLVRMGVDLRTVTGEMKSTSQLMLEISEGLGKMPEGVQRDAAAMDLFKKVGIEAIPVIAGLAENVKRAKELGLGATEEDLQRWEKYHQNVTEAEVLWERFTRKIKEPLAAVVTFLFRDRAGNEYSIGDLQKRGVNVGQWAPRTSWQQSQDAKAAGFGQGAAWQTGGMLDDAMSYTGRIEDRKRADAAVLAFQASEGLQGKLKAAEAALSKMTKPEVGVSSIQDVSDYRAAEQKVAGFKGQIEAGRQATEQMKEFRRAATEFEKKGDESELGAIGKIYYQRDLLLAQAAKLKGVEAEIAGIRKSADEQAGVVMKKDMAAFDAYDQKRQEARAKGSMWMYEPGKAQMQEWGEGFTAADRINSINLQSRRDTLNRNASHTARMVELGGATGIDAIRATYQIRIDLAKELAVIEVERIAKEETGAKQMESMARAQKELTKDIAEAQEEALMKQLEIQKQQLDTLKHASEGLWNTLLTKPGNFGRQLGDTVHAAVLKPITEGLAGMTANVLKPIIYGADGQGGIAGMFKGVFGSGKQDPMKVATDMNTAVTAQNSAVLATLTAILAGGMGMSVPAIAAPGGIGGLSLPSISAPAVAGGGAVVGGGGGFGGFGSGTVAGPGGSSLSGILGIGRGGFGGVLSGLKSAVGLGNISTDSNGGRWAQVGNQSISLDSLGGYANAIGRSPAFGAAGSMLAMQGLLGSSRGTWGGVGMGAVGGAMVGFQMGGPLGALIGGGAGLLAGLGEKIAGVETPENEAKRLVQQIYSLNIDNNTAKQIAAMAKQSYGGNVSSAVRSPEVRQLLQLVAESTGQKSNLFLNNPQGVNFTQTGGVLNQSAVWNNGTPYTYASNLPVSGPAGSTIPTGNPYGGAMNLTLNLNGQSAADVLEGRVGPALVSNSRTVAASSVAGGAASSARVNGAMMMLAPDVVTT